MWVTRLGLWGGNWATGREALQDLGSGFYVLVVTELSGKSSLCSHYRPIQLLTRRASYGGALLRCCQYLLPTPPFFQHFANNQ